jgi:hypothetical protein
MLMLGVFAGMALFLATVGIYSRFSYAVRRRCGKSASGWRSELSLQMSSAW